MSVSLYFGLPGSGKTTFMAAIAYKASKRLGKRKCPYHAIYSNVRLKIPGVTYIDNSCIGTYDLHDALILIDEATLFADNRDYKNFTKDKVMYFLEHRHFNVDIVLFTQQWDGVDRKIRVITDRVFYVYKTVLFGWLYSKCYRVPYGIIIPDPKKSTGEKLGEIIQGYRKPSIFVRIFCTRLFRFRYYKYFDSWERYPLPKLPPIYLPYQDERHKK